MKIEIDEADAEVVVRSLACKTVALERDNRKLAAKINAGHPNSLVFRGYVAKNTAELMTLGQLTQRLRTVAP